MSPQFDYSSSRSTPPNVFTDVPLPIYTGLGTSSNPCVVDWDERDHEHPYNWSRTRKWLITMQVAFCTWTVTFGSSSYSGGLKYTMSDLQISEQISVLGISLYVLGFALGPLVFAPMSELFGRRIIFLATLSVYTPLQLVGALGRDLPSLFVCRLLAGIFGAAPLTNAGAVIADIWDLHERGTATAVYSVIPFLGPIIGPIAGGFIAEHPRLGWRFNFWIMFVFGGISLLTSFFLCPETYTPVLLRRRAHALNCTSKGTSFHLSKHDLDHSRSSGQMVIYSLKRPLVFMTTEPILTLFAIYIATVYGTLYALFSAYPTIFQTRRQWTSSQCGLAFIGVGVGVSIGLATSVIQNKIYLRAAENNTSGKSAPPEERLHMTIVGALLCPVGLFWFALTSSQSIHWIVPILAGCPIGAGTAMILQGAASYLMDVYSLYFASAISATVILRSIFGAIFPLISPFLFAQIGDLWAMSIFALLSLFCMPIPFLFWKFGPWFRSKSVYAYKDSVVRESIRPPSVASSEGTLHTI